MIDISKYTSFKILRWKEKYNKCILTIVSYVDLKKQRNASLNDYLKTRLETTNSKKIALKTCTTSRCVLSFESWLTLCKNSAIDV